MDTYLKDLLDFKKQDHWVKNALDFDIAKLETLLKTKSEEFWILESEKRALDIFHQAAVKIPAYYDFLKKHGVDHKKIVTVKDFSTIPLTDKNNYINAYSLKDRSWNGKLVQNNILALSSGTSGEPVFWPRGSFQEFESVIIHELIYKYLFAIDKYKTLMIIGFPMGVYVSGIATLLPSWIISQKYNLTIAAVGTNRADFIKVISLLQKDYEQVVVVGHPFFIKDVIEIGKEKKIVWSKKRLKMMFCSEGFSEKWREYLLGVAGIKNDPLAIVSTYGSSELLLIGHETQDTVALKQTIEKSKNMGKKILEGKFCAGVFQYNPLLKYIEVVNEELVFTCASGIPLIRYNFHDTGQIVPLRQVTDGFGVKKIPWKLPFLALGNRSDYTIIFYAANIYPDHIKQALDKEEIVAISTGKFVMRKSYARNMEEKLEIHIELREGQKPNRGLERLFQVHIIKKLKEVNMEYLFLWNNLKQDIRPIVRVWSYQNEHFFKPGLKPKYIDKNTE